MKKNSLLISFEGIDYSGKSTQIRKLTEKLSRLQIKNITLREPGGTAIGEKIRQILLDKKAGEMSPETELLLYSAARSQLIREKIIPLLVEGFWVILDRFYDSTIAYQGYGRGLSPEKIEQITNFAVEENIPDVTFYLRLSLQEMSARKVASGREEDRMESNRDGFFQKIFQGYEEIAAKHHKRVEVINAGQKEDEVFNEVWERLSRYL